MKAPMQSADNSAQQIPNVGIDGHVLSGKHQGSRTVLVRLLNALAEIGRSQNYIVYADDVQSASKALGNGQYDIRPIGASNAVARLLIYMPRRLQKDRIRIGIWQYVISPLAFFQKNVVFIYDILPFTHPHLFPLKFRIKCIATHFFSMLISARICTESETAMKEIQKLFPTFASKVRLVRCGPSFDQEVYFPRPQIERKRPRPYVLTVGRIEARRNIDMLIRAFRRAVPEGADLIVVGKRDLGFQLAAPLPSNVAIVENVTDDELIELYREASLFAYPSSAEGFGIPLLDAVLFGLPCISSNRTALPEVGGRFASYFDPEAADAEDVLSGLIERHFKGEVAMSGSIDQRLAHARLFNWKASASSLDDIVNELTAEAQIR